MTISSGQGRVNPSVGHLRVASMSSWSRSWRGGPKERGRGGLSSRLRFHVRPQNGIDAGLVAGAVLSQPRDHIVVHPDRESVLGFGHTEPGGFPERFIQFGDVRVIDIRIRHGA